MSILNFTRTPPSQLGNASPSLALERGNYRMRAPVSRPPPLLLREMGNVEKPSVRKPPQHHLNRTLAILLMLLTLACMTCFGTAYYLFTSRWDFRAVYPPYVSNSTSQVNVSDGHVGLMDPSAKYLTYLPHSGFHNQRIAFENALLLSYLLRRTLLVPPIHLGTRPIRYVEYDTLFRFHQLLGKDGLNHCLDVPVYVSFPLECLEYFETTSVPWTWLVDLTVITARQPLFQRPNMSQNWLQMKFGFNLSDMHTIRDDSPYRFRFLDSAHDSSMPAGKYQEDIDVTHLETIQERLLQVGTLFGTSRLRLQKEESIDYQRLIRQNMVFTNQDLLEAANRISRFFHESYIGIHLRTSDGKFKTELGSTLRLIWVEVLEEVLGFSTSDICELEKAVQEDLLPLSCRFLEITPKPRQNSWYWASAVSHSYTGPCRSSRHHVKKYQPLNIPLYIATDLKGAESHPAMMMFRRIFPCLFFITDFKKETAPLETLKSQYDGVILYPYLLPFVDALVLGNAQKVVGTPGSTFSKFVKEVLWTNKTV